MKSSETEPFDKQSPTDEPAYLTVPEISRIWNMSEDTVRSIFRDEPGVRKIERPETRSKRRYTTVRIPPDVFKRVDQRMTVK